MNAISQQATRNRRKETKENMNHRQAVQGFRCIAPDRRGHGRSDAPNHGYDADTLADDVAAVIEQKNLKQIVLVAHSTGAIESVRYCAGTGWIESSVRCWRHR